MNNFQFPPYLALGKLNYNSIRENEDGLTADYEFLGEKVMEVLVKPAQTIITTYFQNENEGISRSPFELKRAFFRHFLDIPLHKSKAFRFMVEKVSSLGNVWFSLKEEQEQSLVFYPGGSIMMVRIPLEDAGTMKVIDLFADLFNKRIKSIIYPSRLGIRRKGEIDFEYKTIFIFEISIPVAFLHDLVDDLINKYNIISDEKIFRAIICEKSNNHGDSLQLFIGDENDDWAEYFIEFKNKPVNR